MKKNVLLIVAAMVMSLGFLSCSDDKAPDTSRVQLKLIDAEGDYKKVEVEIIDIQYNRSGEDNGWTSFTPENGYPINVDLTQLIAGNSLLLADEIIPSGMLKQIRLVLSDNNMVEVVVKSEGDQEETIKSHLETPSALQSGLKLNLNSELVPGFSYTFILDWDVQKSIVNAGDKGKYNLKPVIRVNTEVNSGSIEGKVVKASVEADLEVPLAGVKVSVYTLDNDYVAGSESDLDGNFLIQGLEQGDYKIKIEGFNYESIEVFSVTPGIITSAGIIVLDAV